MCIGIFALFILSVSNAQEKGRYENFEAITPYLVHKNDLPNVAHFDDAEHRGPNWYDYSQTSEETASDMHSDISSETLSDESDTDTTSSQSSSEGSSEETKERRKVTEMHRACTPCPHDMLKSYKNIGIKWICGGYQRARRSFKSECMMRFRNCQDGTLFVKISDHKCGTMYGRPGNATLPWHGKHWFYEYRV